MNIDWYRVAGMVMFVASVFFTLFLLWAAISLFILAFAR